MKFKSFLLGSSLCLGSLFAYNHPCPKNWQFSGDFLYLLPTFDDTYYVINSSATNVNNPIGTRENNDFGFKPAFRVGAEYSFCGPEREFQLFYSRLNSSQSRTVSGNFLWATIGRPDASSQFENYIGTAASKLHVRYQQGDALYTQRVLNSSGLYLFLEPGIEVAGLRLKETYDYRITASTNLSHVAQKSTLWGIGPQLGLEVGYDLYKESSMDDVSKKKDKANGNDSRCNCTHTVSATGFFSTSLLASHSKASMLNTTTISSVVTTIANVPDEHTWRVIPALHARAGLNYSVDLKSVGLALGAGYEFNSYIRGVSRLLFSDDIADGMCSTNYYNFDVQGLYVSAAVSF